MCQQGWVRGWLGLFHAAKSRSSSLHQSNVLREVSSGYRAGDLKQVQPSSKSQPGPQLLRPPPATCVPPLLWSPLWLPSAQVSKSDSFHPLHRTSSVCAGVITPVLPQLACGGLQGGGEDPGMGVFLCFTSCLCPQDCSAMHPWTSLAPAGPRAPQGSWWFAPAQPISTASDTTPQVRGRVAGRLVGCGLSNSDNNHNNASHGYSHQRPALLCWAPCAHTADSHSAPGRHYV